MRRRAAAPRRRPPPPPSRSRHGSACPRHVGPCHGPAWTSRTRAQALATNSDREIAGRAQATLGLIAKSRGQHTKRVNSSLMPATSLRDIAAQAALRAGTPSPPPGRTTAAKNQYQGGSRGREEPVIKQVLQSRLDTGSFTVQLGVFTDRRNADKAASNVGSRTSKAGLGQAWCGSGRARRARPSTSSPPGRYEIRFQATAAQQRLGQVWSRHWRKPTRIAFGSPSQLTVELPGGAPRVYLCAGFFGKARAAPRRAAGSGLNMASQSRLRTRGWISLAIGVSFVSTLTACPPAESEETSQTSPTSEPRRTQAPAVHPQAQAGPLADRAASQTVKLPPGVDPMANAAKQRVQVDANSTRSEPNTSARSATRKSARSA